jgi:hypothetical protein
MGGFDALADSVNKACLGIFGQALKFIRIQSGAETLSITGILESAAEFEESSPGDCSVYARLWIRAADIDPPPERGDEIATESAVYKILDIEQDAGGGLRMLLRQDRMIIR